MTVCAFDLSLTGSGWATYNGTITSGTLRPPAGMLGDARFDWMVEAVLDRAEPADFRIFEDLSFGSNMPGASERTGLAHVIRWNLRPHKFQLVAPASLKKFAAGSGAAKKEHMMLNVFQRWGITARDNNEADAIGLLYVGMALNGLWEPTTDAQRQVLAVLRSPKGKR